MFFLKEVLHNLWLTLCTTQIAADIFNHLGFVFGALPSYSIGFNIVVE
jgi:hypothetical protein